LKLLGFIPRNEYDFKNTKEKDAYSNQLKVNILGNIKENIPNYQGYRISETCVDRNLSQNFLSQTKFNSNC
jgi:hypothetical protein